MHGNNKCADQPVHPLSYFITFVVNFLESMIIKVATLQPAKSNVSSNHLAEQTSLTYTYDSLTYVKKNINTTLF